MKLTIATVSEVLFDGEAYSVSVPSSDGELTLLSDHMPLISTLKRGSVVVVASKDGSSETFPIEGGLLEVGGNRATIVL